MEKIFKDQVAMISGGMGDIGFATALALAGRGAHIALCDVLPPASVVEKIKIVEDTGVRCTYDEVDIADAAAVQAWMDAVHNTLGAAQLIIANAAITRVGGIYDITPQEWRRDIDVNLNGAFYLTQAATALLLKHRLPGRVVFVGSWAGARAHAYIPAYSVAKAGMTMLCKCMALELAPHQILVNEIAPGYVAAGLTGQIWKDNPGNEKAARARVPTGTVITAEEVAEQIVYLCDPANRQMTGSTLLMDGGLSLT